MLIRIIKKILNKAKNPQRVHKVPLIQRQVHKVQKANNHYKKALEHALYSINLGVAGRTDYIADFDGELSTIDFKTTSKMRDEPIENYLLQATFYATAWEEQTGERIKQIVIITGAENGQLDVKTDDPSKYTDKLKKIIEEYKA